jgi:hypothetical protein
MQLVYTTATLLPCAFLHRSFLAHTWYIITLVGVCVWNGASFYIEVRGVAAGVYPPRPPPCPTF